MQTILILILTIFITIFATQNADITTISFLWWHMQASLAIVIAVCLLSGICMTLLALIPKLLRHRKDTKQLQDKLDTLLTENSQRKP